MKYEQEVTYTEVSNNEENREKLKNVIRSLNESVTQLRMNTGKHAVALEGQHWLSLFDNREINLSF